jgi:hypothetical protein
MLCAITAQTETRSPTITLVPLVQLFRQHQMTTMNRGDRERLDIMGWRRIAGASRRMPVPEPSCSHGDGLSPQGCEALAGAFGQEEDYKGTEHCLPRGRGLPNITKTIAGGLGQHLLLKSCLLGEEHGRLLTLAQKVSHCWEMLGETSGITNPDTPHSLLGGWVWR